MMPDLLEVTTGRVGIAIPGYLRRTLVAGHSIYPRSCLAVCISVKNNGLASSSCWRACPLVRGHACKNAPWVHVWCWPQRAWTLCMT